MDPKSRFLKVIPPSKTSKKEADPIGLHLDPLDRLKGTVLNLTENALSCLNRVSQREMQKDSPSSTFMEEYFLLHHYLDFIERLCRGKKDISSETLLEEYLFLHESMHFE
jgi:hypothetical protein